MSEGSEVSPGWSRRGVLAAVAGSFPVLAGCAGGEGGPSTTSPPVTTTDGTTVAGETTSGGSSTTTGGSSTAERTGTATGEKLELREANVTGVEFERTDGGYRFSVTLYHDDDGEEGYANWWQLETTGGERLGRRELLHAHGTREFTRSATVAIPEDVTRVVVRGHDQEHGYGGQAAVVDLGSGAVSFVRQGPDREPVGE